MSQRKRLQEIISKQIKKSSSPTGNESMNIYFRNIYREWLRKLTLSGQEKYIIDILISYLFMNDVLTNNEYSEITHGIIYADKLQVDS